MHCLETVIARNNSPEEAAKIINRLDAANRSESDMQELCNNFARDCRDREAA